MTHSCEIFLQWGWHRSAMWGVWVRIPASYWTFSTLDIFAPLTWIVALFWSIQKVHPRLILKRYLSLPLANKLSFLTLTNISSHLMTTWWKGYSLKMLWLLNNSTRLSCLTRWFSLHAPEDGQWVTFISLCCNETTYVILKIIAWCVKFKLNTLLGI